MMIHSSFFFSQLIRLQVIYGVNVTGEKNEIQGARVLTLHWFVAYKVIFAGIYNIPPNINSYLARWQSNLPNSSNRITTISLTSHGGTHWWSSGTRRRLNPTLLLFLTSAFHFFKFSWRKIAFVLTDVLNYQWQSDGRRNDEDYRDDGSLRFPRYDHVDVLRCFLQLEHG